MLERFNPPSLPPPDAGLNSQIVRDPRTGTTRFSGFAALDREGELVGAGDMGTQVNQVYDNVELALEHLERDWDSVLHLTVYTVDADAYLAVEREAVQHRFQSSPPASTVVQVARLLDPAWLVEVQADVVS